MSQTNDARAQRSGVRLDPARIAFWSALAVAAGAAGVALTAGPEVGRVGAILFLSLAAIGFVFFLWLSRHRGRQVGLFPDKGAAEAAALAAHGGEYALLEGIAEPALVSDRNGAAVAANGVYLKLAEFAGALAESERAPMFDRLFGADPLLSAPMYRLSRAASLGETRSEVLPPVALRADSEPHRYEASVAPIGADRVLWRLRPMASSAVVEGDAARGLFVDDAPLGFFAARADGTVVYVNQALRAVLGYGDETPLLRLRDFIKEDTVRVLRRDRRGLGASRSEVTLRARDGAETPAVVLTYWPAADGDAACRVLVFFGEAEAAAPAAAERAARAGEPTEAFFEHAPFGAALLDGGDPAAASILDANQALMEMAQGRAAPGARFADLFEAGEGLDTLNQKLRKSSQGAPVELAIATEPPTAAHVHVVRMGDGRALAYVVNVAEQRELEQRLAQAEKMREIGLLAGGVAHDFNNLLTVMMQTTDYLLLRHPVGDPDYVELNQINIHALRAKELSEMLRAYARQQTFKVEILEVAGFMQQMHEIGRRLAGDAVKVEIQHGQSLPFVKADRTQLERVLVNLISNARDAMTPKDESFARGGTLGLRTSRVGAADVRKYAMNVPVDDGDYVQIEVSDTGCGIKEEDKLKIFHPFHSTKEPNKGTGLGLATCYGIIKQSGGYIFFDSAPGKGTTFRIFLPAYAPTSDELADMARVERAQASRRPVDASGRGRRILFVEDDDDVRNATARNLREFGFEIIPAEDGEDALRILREQPGAFDVVISDVSMPVMNGPEMLRAAGAELIGGAKVLLLSGYAPESVSKMIEDIPVSFLSKPVGARTLAERVKELLAA